MQVNLNKIKGLMAEHGDTQKDLADKLGISDMTLRNYLGGKTEMRVDTIGKIAEIYKVAPLVLLTFEK
jgi:transcriptional regulator with XRE-family HTH domain